MFPVLTTQRLLLQEILPDDQPFIFEGLSHPDVILFYGVSYQTYEATAAQMQWYAAMLNEGTGVPWKIVGKENGEKIGVISVYFYKPEHNKAELGFWLLPPFWNKGFAFEALNAVVAFWKTEKKLHRLEAFVEEGNTASSGLLEKAGFRYEGTMRDCEIKNGQYVSLLVFALLFDA
jgi:ribosomal-protein-alanine N-acetyltransferase